MVMTTAIICAHGSIRRNDRNAVYVDAFIDVNRMFGKAMRPTSSHTRTHIG